VRSGESRIKDTTIIVALLFYTRYSKITTCNNGDWTAIVISDCLGKSSGDLGDLGLHLLSSKMARVPKSVSNVYMICA